MSRSYKRPVNPRSISRSDKVRLLAEYVQYYEQIVSSDPGALNRKTPRKAFVGLLNGVGVLLLKEAERLAKEPGAIRNFLAANTLPRSMAKMLPENFRVFCLALNALKQWVSAEQAASDRYLLGGVARDLCRKAVTRDLITRKLLGPDAELHHPVRDGRPPLAISQESHARLEGQVPKSAVDYRRS